MSPPKRTICYHFIADIPRYQNAIPVKQIKGKRNGNGFTSFANGTPAIRNVQEPKRIKEVRSGTGFRLKRIKEVRSGTGFRLKRIKERRSGNGFLLKRIKGKRSGSGFRAIVNGFRAFGVGFPAKRVILLFGTYCRYCRAEGAGQAAEES